jgi:hypothetical protein
MFQLGCDHARQAEAAARSDGSREVFLSQSHNRVGGLIVAGSQPAFVLARMRCLEDLANQESFELRGGVTDLLGAVLSGGGRADS